MPSGWGGGGDGGGLIVTSRAWRDKQADEQ